MHWVTVDRPESVALCERLLPTGERQTTIAASALDADAWIGTRPSLITAQGLLMYLDREAVHGLFARLEPAALLFDLVSKRLAAHSRKPREGTSRPLGPTASTRPNWPRSRCATCSGSRFPMDAARSPGFVVPLASRIVRLISIYRARTIAASSSTSTTPAITSTAASATNAASAAREAARATRRDA